MKYEAWLANVHPRIKAEPIWKSVMYQKALFLYDLVWEDCSLLMKDARGRKVAEQLIDSAGSISANMEKFMAVVMAKSASIFCVWHSDRHVSQRAGINGVIICCLPLSSNIVSPCLTK